MKHYDAAITSVSWIPSEAIRGATRLPFDFGLAHYDKPPRDRVDFDTLVADSADDRFRFANHLTAWIEVDEAGRIAEYDQGGGGIVSSTRVKVASNAVAQFSPYVQPELRPEPVVAADLSWVRFTQTAGGRTGLPAPRLVRRWPFVQWRAPWVWTTVEITMHADGRVEHKLAGATPFPRHWVYGSDGSLIAKSGLTEFRRWYRHAFGRLCPWKGVDLPALVADAETPLERVLSVELMQKAAAKAEVRRVRAGAVLMRQGEAADDLMLVLDGMVEVSVDGRPLVELGPGALLGERAGFEGGRRTATIVATTPVMVAVAPRRTVAAEPLDDLRAFHRRELAAA